MLVGRTFAARDDAGLVRLLQILLNNIAPLRCAFCGCISSNGEGPVCVPCKDDLPAATPAVPASPLDSAIAPFAYEFPVDAAIKALKFRRKLFYGAAFAHLLLEYCEELPDDIDALLPVPLHWRRQWFRGFNQAVEIGRPLAKQLGVPVFHVVKRCRSTASQSGLTAAERARNLQAAFVVKGRLCYEHVLIVDDVITTGTTVRQVARSLRHAGVKKVSALAVARA